MNKPFARRPWSKLDAGYNYHIDGVHVQEAGFYVCLHTSQELLRTNNRQCDSDRGWWWPKFVLEDFSVTNLNENSGVYITDGVVDGVQFQVVIQGGKFVNLGPAAQIACLRYLECSKVTIRGLRFTDVRNPVVEFDNCGIDLLEIIDCDPFQIKPVKSEIILTRLTGCPKFECPPMMPVERLDPPTTLTGGMVGAMAINVRVGGKLFKAEARNVQFTS